MQEVRICSRISEGKLKRGMISIWDGGSRSLIIRGVRIFGSHEVGTAV